jgi:hypothetical protein
MLIGRANLAFKPVVWKQKFVGTVKFALRDDMFGPEIAAALRTCRLRCRE